MFRTLDLRAVTVLTGDLEAAVANFRASFGFPLRRESESPEVGVRTKELGIGPAVIEMTTPVSAGSPLARELADRGAGLHAVVLAVDSLGSAAVDLSARGIGVSRGVGVDGRAVVLVDPAATNGARIVLVERG